MQRELGREGGRVGRKGVGRSKGEGVLQCNVSWGGREGEKVGRKGVGRGKGDYSAT